MSESVNVNFRMDKNLKHNVEEICARMGMNLTTALTIFCRKLEQERRIPFEITADPYALEAFEDMRAQAAALPEMTLEEINKEIATVRTERKN